MCTYSININNDTMPYLLHSFKSEVDINRWLQRQVDILVARVVSQNKTDSVKEHAKAIEYVKTLQIKGADIPNDISGIDCLVQEKRLR